MQGILRQISGALIAAFSLLGSLAAAEDAPPTTTVVISIAEQKLVILRDGGFWKKYPISTSKFGVGDSFGSYKTPLGRLRISEKIGDDLAAGAVLKQRHATGEVLPVNSPGRDPIVTRILWLDGLEEQNRNARSRGIYIHGTNEESKIGEPVSYGCIRMRSRDVLEVFDEAPLGTAVSIIAEKFPKFQKYTPPKLPVIATAPPSKPPARTVASTPPATKPATPAPVSTSPPQHAPAITASKPEPPPNPTASHAMMGSILDAGLPQGPKIPTLPAPPEPRDVPRFSAWASEPAKESAFSLQGIARDLSPAIRAADADTTARAAAAKEQDETAPAEKKRIAFRAAPSKEKQAP